MDWIRVRSKVSCEILASANSGCKAHFGHWKFFSLQDPAKEFSLGWSLGYPGITALGSIEVSFHDWKVKL